MKRVKVKLQSRLKNSRWWLRHIKKVTKGQWTSMNCILRHFCFIFIYKYVVHIFFSSLRAQLCICKKSEFFLSSILQNIINENKNELLKLDYKFIKLFATVALCCRLCVMMTIRDINERFIFSLMGIIFFLLCMHTSLNFPSLTIHLKFWSRSHKI